MKDIVEQLNIDDPMPARELSVSFGYQCNTSSYTSSVSIEDEFNASESVMTWSSAMKMRNGSFSCLSGAALSANATLANTRICNGIIGEEILPSMDSPKSFRRLASSPSLSRLDLVSSSFSNSTSPLVGSGSPDSEIVEDERTLCQSKSTPTRTESSSFLNAMDVQMAGGAAGEDRVQAVCSEENGWLFCGIYDGFNGRDAADFLAGTLYDRIASSLHNLEWRTRKLHVSCESSSLHQLSGSASLEHGNVNNDISLTTYPYTLSVEDREIDPFQSSNDASTHKTFFHGVINCLNDAVAQAESDFLYMVEREMKDRPDLVSVGSCVLVALLHMNDIYLLNLGDSRAILATSDGTRDGALQTIQLTETHTVDNDSEKKKLLEDHPDDPRPIVNGRVKGKLKVTRAFGVGYLKESKMNDMLMGILRIQNLCSPPYVYSHPFTTSHRVSEKDRFVVLGSDGLFDFFSNDEVAQLVHLFIQQNPVGDPAKHLIEELVQRAANNAGFSTDELLNIPAGRRRKYHDDVTVIVITLGNKQRTSTASTSLEQPSHSLFTLCQ
ncbi:probable protein phosphatase 2C 40 [Rhodamnia argentea]|uniref:protein-serine/threonine phosphatase n=1 Tax=Rhodamnia argentea TaxID=178133 RepID=A0A8B8PQX9_9MYRT|nr:probable protein phosphatase 2C 40 [Rhodamnia argentea]XP_030536721.1 probable protein phosphatase 2C 40 [Rhodamnia argentea]XP_030536722.1 probable protein phosphatase 2C 40 [Rhodamnia argentea]XP_030536723.1 probable protein phosphatase 2C 40 [Rhodamnia argentea]XP_030536724.1 probable protein phosphatase 2C 40 [Rhodamnia argentea]XP_048139390.1 probable protein phosphatase 2C 40 [Rhodamnia argentea]XP_048139391.1 probable protein phosphatase 2C 40 [Rhodamnia argentea]